MTTAGKDGKEFVRTEKIPLYLNGVKVFGNEPPQIEPSPTPSDGPGSTPPPSQKPSLEVLYNTEIQRQLQKISEAPLN